MQIRLGGSHCRSLAWRAEGNSTGPALWVCESLHVRSQWLGAWPVTHRKVVSSIAASIRRFAGFVSGRRISRPIMFWAFVGLLHGGAAPVQGQMKWFTITGVSAPHYLRYDYQANADLWEVRYTIKNTYNYATLMVQVGCGAFAVYLD